MTSNGFTSKSVPGSQRGELNPILAAFREIGDPELPEPWVGALYVFAYFGAYPAWEEPGAYFHALTLAHAGHHRHARRVLTRLAALKEGSTP